MKRIWLMVECGRNRVGLRGRMKVGFWCRFSLEIWRGSWLAAVRVGEDGMEVRGR